MSKNYLTEDEFNLPIDEFVVRCHELLPATYGKMMVKKIVLDTKHQFSPVYDSDEKGDGVIRQKSYSSSTNQYYEVKTSYLNKSGRFGIKNIRGWQKFDYFILCLIDTSGEEYEPYFYCIPKEVITKSPFLTLTGQNNTKQSNDKNTEVGQSTTFDLNDHTWLFKKKSVLKGNTYSDLMNYISEMSGGVKTNNVVKRNIIKPRKATQKIYLTMGELIINGSSNKDVMTNLVKYIGAHKLYGILWKTWLNKVENEDRSEYVGDGYYLNPKFSLRDINKTLKQINKKLNLSFNIVNK